MKLETGLLLAAVAITIYAFVYLHWVIKKLKGFPILQAQVRKVERICTEFLLFSVVLVCAALGVSSKVPQVLHMGLPALIFYGAVINWILVDARKIQSANAPVRSG